MEFRGKTLHKHYIFVNCKFFFFFKIHDFWGYFYIFVLKYEF